MRRGGLLLLILLAPWLRAAGSIEIGEIKHLTLLGPIHGWWAKVRLDAPDLEPVVTHPLTRAERKNPEGTEAHLLPVDAWAKSVDAVLAVNANYFSRSLIPPKEGEPKEYKTGQPVDLVGLSLSDGKIVSAPRSADGHADPALIIERSGKARIGFFGKDDLQNARCAVAGIGAAEKQPGTLLVTNGQNSGGTARVQPNNKNPRTAAGVTADGRTLILVVVDGRQPTHSVGMTLPELADLLIELGAHNAVNLDGGGSSSFYFVNSDGTVVTNQPSDGHWRPVGNHLGFVRRDPKRN